MPEHFSEQKLEQKVSQFQRSSTANANGIETFVSSYKIDYLDKMQYDRIIDSAMVNAKKSGRTTESKQPVNRVTVIFICAKQMEEALRLNLFDMVQKQTGDGNDMAVLPCIVDLAKKTCTFDSERIPYLGLQYPVKNGGIKIIRKLLFNNKLPLSESLDMLEPIKDIDLNQSLWKFWKDMKADARQDDEQKLTRFEKMNHGEIFQENNLLYIKWQQLGILTDVTVNEGQHTIKIYDFDTCIYPEPDFLDETTKTEVMNMIVSHYTSLGYRVQ